ncbi:MAG: glycosyltransferase [Simkaniaceae bacterium]
MDAPAQNVFLHIFIVATLWYFFLLNSFYGLLIICTLPEILRRNRELKLENLEKLIISETLPSVSIIIPAYNEEKKIVDTVTALLEISYPYKEIIIVSDGSEDATLKNLIEHFALKREPPLAPEIIATKPLRGYYRSDIHPNLIVIDKENGGKGDAINAGLNVASFTLFTAIDADTVIEKDSLLRMIRPFLTKENCIAQGGTLRVQNGCVVKHGRVQKVFFPKNLLPGIQAVEYLRAFLFGRLGWNKLGGNFIVSGAFGFFSREKVIKVGGYDVNTVGEDLELSLRLVHNFSTKKKRAFINFIPDPVAWTLVPTTLRHLGRQRERWFRGLLESFWKHKNMMWRPKYGIFAFTSVPYMLFGEILQPFVELACYISVIYGFIVEGFSWDFFWLFFFITWGLTMIYTLAAVILEMMTFKRYNYAEELGEILLSVIIENLGFRQLNMYWRIRGIGKVFRKSREW